MKTSSPLRQQTHSAQVTEDSFVRKIRRFVTSRLSDDLRVEEIAAIVSITRIQFFRKIKARTGQSPSRFVRAIRLQKALELLRTTDQSISDIAYSVGFNDPKYFSRVFAAEYGWAPSQIRK